MINKPVHPGVIVKEVCVNATGLTITEAANKLGIDRSALSRLINEHVGISAEMAVRLSIALGGSATLWMNLQRDYDLWCVEKFCTKMKVEKFKKAA